MASPGVTASLIDSEPTVMRLNVTSCKRITSGRSKGNEWTLFGVDCVTEEGEVLDRNCLSFYLCRRGVAEYEVMPQQREGHEPSYLLKPIEPEDMASTLERLEILEERVAAMAAIVYEQKPVAG